MKTMIKFEQRNKQMKVGSFCIGMILGLLLCVFSCTEREEVCYLEKAIQQNTLVFPLIYVPDSAILLVGVNSQCLIDELRNHMGKKDPEEFLYKSIEDHMPIRISREFYNESQRYLIYPDSAITRFYVKRGISALLKTYAECDGSEGLWIQQPFSDGDNLCESVARRQLEYISYLLFYHNIYFQSEVVNDNGNLRIPIDKFSSDNKYLKVFVRKKSK